MGSLGVLLLPSGCDASSSQVTHQHYHLGWGHVRIKCLIKHHTMTLAAAWTLNLPIFGSGRGGGWLPYKKEGGAGWQFWKHPPGGTKIMFVGVTWNFFASKRYQRQNNILTDSFINFNGNKDNCKEYFPLVKLFVKNLLLYFFSSIPERYLQSFQCGSFEAEHPESYQNHLFNP